MLKAVLNTKIGNEIVSDYSEDVKDKYTNDVAYSKDCTAYRIMEKKWNLQF